MKKPPRTYMLHSLTDNDKTQSGVFVIRNTCDSRVYVGATKHLLNAFRQVRNDLRDGKHSSDRLQAFAAAHGLGVLRFEALELCPVDQMPAVKQRHLDQLQTSDPAHGFNILNAPVGPGQRLSSEARARISLGKKGRAITPRTLEHQEKLAAAHRGRKRSPEACANMRGERGKRKPRGP
ncbi:hypothetical protein IC235_17430 [Hymenobacter sp. BT664]|uniref:GIY-YIG domain-containing protein n=1 Tax=Hymenobacter montanus TaxID=2771359 RepID=A0A927GKP0_9BACT|nr:hypothetical protein [Hymenobacter montanus]MBD2769675.1 hypothetical protein [Hymenobacter montanus]